MKDIVTSGYGGSALNKFPESCPLTFSIQVETEC